MTVTVWLAMAHFIVGVNRLQKFPTSQAACEASVSTVVYLLTEAREDHAKCCNQTFGAREHIQKCIEGVYPWIASCDEENSEKLEPFECVSSPSYSVKPLTP